MKLLIRNLSRTTTEAELEELFAFYGAVQSCSLVKDSETGESKGFGFVMMPKAGDAKAAMKNINGATIAGNVIRVKKAEEKPAATEIVEEGFTAVNTSEDGLAKDRRSQGAASKARRSENKSSENTGYENKSAEGRRSKSKRSNDESSGDEFNPRNAYRTKAVKATSSKHQPPKNKSSKQNIWSKSAK